MASPVLARTRRVLKTQSQSVLLGEEPTFLDLQVSNDDIGRIQDTEANAIQFNRTVRAENRGVCPDSDNSVTREGGCEEWKLTRELNQGVRAYQSL